MWPGNDISKALMLFNVIYINFIQIFFLVCSPPPPPPCTDRLPVTSITSNGASTFVDEDDDIYEVPVAQEDSGMLSGKVATNQRKNHVLSKVLLKLDKF